jgi:hypothetical protein
MVTGRSSTGEAKLQEPSDDESSSDEDLFRSEADDLGDEWDWEIADFRFTKSEARDLREQLDRLTERQLRATNNRFVLSYKDTGDQ